MGKLISLIVPIYNAERVLIRCVESILSQSYKNIELILINDGSTDGSLKICEYFKEIDNRVKIIDKENQGVSKARNAGLRISRGDYIGFIDADDWIEKNMFERLMSTINQENADIAICSYYEESANITSKRVEFESKSIYTFEEGLENFIKGKYGGNIWNKLFCRSVISHEFNETIVIGEDSLFLYNAIKKSKKIVCLPEALYHYSISYGSATKIELNKKRFDTLKSSELIYDDIQTNHLTFFDDATFMVFSKYIALLNLILFYDYELKFFNYLENIVKRLDHLSKILNNTSYSRDIRLFLFRLYKFNVGIYKTFVKIKYKKKLNI